MKAALALLLLPLAAQAQPTGHSWDWQLQSPRDLSVDVDILVLDPDETSAEEIANLKTRGIYTVCYVSIGTLEDWREDKDAFPDYVIGKPYKDWPGEVFLDIRHRGVLVPLMRARFETCAALGFDAIEPDNMDVYTNDSGFDIWVEQALAYIRALDDVANDLGLEFAQKNVPELTGSLAPFLDFVIAEDCYADGWCADLDLYRQLGKPILDAEYTIAADARAEACAAAAGMGISMIFKSLDLDATGARCP